jgi:2-polyprenyl-6-methoxyphenol hydroxylase-like FAD-dependent oxidoreductase
MTRALIIGGGIGGLAAAVALRRIGVDAVVFERAPEIREVGAGLSLWSNAVTALRRLGLEEAVTRGGSPVRRIRTLTSDGTLLSEMPFDAVSRKAGAPCVCVHRADLQKILAGALPPEAIRTNSTCVGFEQQEDGVTARFEDGRAEAGDLLVGADGIRSAIRTGLFGNREPRYAGYTCWRGMARFEPPELAAGVSLFALGAGSQMGLFRCGPGRVYWFVTRNASAGGADPPAGHRRAVLAVIEGWHPTFCAAIEAAEEAAVFRNDIIDRPPIRGWGAGRVTLLGDAVHPTTPNLGQGACQALEDAVVLADRVRHCGPNAAALREYEDRRRERTASITRRSWSSGRCLQWQSPPAVWLRDRLFRTSAAHRIGLKLFEELLSYQVPELTRS